MNQYLHDNEEGLTFLWQELKIPGKGFTIDSARNMVHPLRVNGEAYVPDVNKNFTYCMMTVLKDMTN